MIRILAVTAAGLLAAPSITLAQDWRDEYSSITFGAAVGENAQDAASRWAPFGEYLAECMGIDDVVVRVANDYSALIESMAQGDLHLLWVSPVGYSILHDITDGDVDPVAVEFTRDGNMGYYWTVVVRADSDYQSIEDLEGATIGMASPTSTTGYVLPMQYFRDKGYVDESDNPTFFSGIVHTGSHDNGIMSVVQGNIDASTSWYYSPEEGNHSRMVGNGLIEEDDIRFIYESAIVPNSPFVAPKSLPEDMRFQMSACFVNMHFTAPEAFESVTDGVFGGFGLVSADVYQPFIDIRQAEK